MRKLVAGLFVMLTSGVALADPCGMVGPMIYGPVPPITRVGPQRTYVFYDKGVETYVIRPGFSGKVDEFGMLIPFPSVPSLRKVPDTLFAQLTAAIDPPEIVVDLRRRMRGPYPSAMAGASRAKATVEDEAPLAYTEVKVLKQEAVGMYEVVVLAAGSAEALNRWMDEHGFKYPQGMDDVVNDYVKQHWVFVAEKTKVGSKPNSDPKPGMREVDPSIPAGSTFDGYVQAMGFRFKVDKPIVPMRLSPFNPGEKRQIVYYLTKNPIEFDGVGSGLVKRQIGGQTLYDNVTLPIPLRVIGGTLTQQQIDGYAAQRNATPFNGQAKDLFGSDLLALQSGDLSLPFEEEEKELLRIGEALEMRGPEVDTLHEAELAVERNRAAAEALHGLKKLTLTVIDGNFDEKWMKEHDLTIHTFAMKDSENTQKSYDASVDGPSNRWYIGQGTVLAGERGGKKDWYKDLWK